MKAIELDSNDIKEILKLIPKKQLKDIMKIIEGKRESSNIELVEHFVKNFNSDDPFDVMMAHLLKDVLLTVSAEYNKKLDESKSRGEQAICGHHVGDAVINSLQTISDKIKAAKDYEKQHVCNDGVITH